MEEITYEIEAYLKITHCFGKNILETTKYIVTQLVIQFNRTNLYHFQEIIKPVDFLPEHGSEGIESSLGISL